MVRQPKSPKKIETWPFKLAKNKKLKLHDSKKPQHLTMHPRKVIKNIRIIMKKERRGNKIKHLNSKIDPCHDSK